MFFAIYLQVFQQCSVSIFGRVSMMAGMVIQRLRMFSNKSSHVWVLEAWKDPC